MVFSLEIYVWFKFDNLGIIRERKEKGKECER